MALLITGFALGALGGLIAASLAWDDGFRVGVTREDV